MKKIWKDIFILLKSALFCQFLHLFYTWFTYHNAVTSLIDCACYGMYRGQQSGRTARRDIRFDIRARHQASTTRHDIRTGHLGIDIGAGHFSTTSGFGIICDIQGRHRLFLREKPIRHPQELTAIVPLPLTLPTSLTSLPWIKPGGDFSYSRISWSMCSKRSHPLRSIKMIVTTRLSLLW